MEKAKVLGTAKLSTKNQVTVPTDVRRRFGFKIGDLLIFQDSGGKLVVERA